MIKVAAYCRVSTDKDDQANSFESQQRYFREYIDRQPDWELVDVYADEGITGTSTKKRTAFNRMINDAYQGRIQIIVTKEISRFSRNIVDTLTYTRELKQLGRCTYSGVQTACRSFQTVSAGACGTGCNRSAYFLHPCTRPLGAAPAERYSPSLWRSVS